MGVILTPIVQPRALTLAELRGRSLAVDGTGALYEFLALMARGGVTGKPYYWAPFQVFTVTLN